MGWSAQAVEAGMAPEAAAGRKRAPRLPAWPGWAAPLRVACRVAGLFVVMCAISAPLLAYQIHRNPGLTTIDEPAYLDYIQKVHRGHFIVGNGEQIDPASRQEIACRGVSPHLPIDPDSCQHPPTTAAGRNSADIDPPTYYVLTDLGARVALGLRVTHNLTTAARLVGIAWAGAALTVLYLLAGLLGASRLSAGIVSVAVLATGGVHTFWTHVTPHAADLLVGGLVVAGVLMWDRRRLGGWVLPLCGGLPVLVKASNATVVAAVLLFLLAGALWPAAKPTPAPDRPADPDQAADPERPAAAAAGGDRRRYAVGALLVFAGLLAASVLWLAVRRHYALTTSNEFPRFNVTSFQWRWLGDDLGTFVRPYQVSASADILLALWLSGTIIRYLTAPAGDGALRRLSLAALVTSVVGAWLYVFSNYLLIHQHYRLPGRYGLTLLPLVAALGAANLRPRSAQVVAALYVGVLVVVAVHTGRPPQG